jgi:hypothetical protein
MAKSLGLVPMPDAPNARADSRRSRRVQEKATTERIAAMKAANDASARAYAAKLLRKDDDRSAHSESDVPNEADDQQHGQGAQPNPSSTSSRQETSQEINELEEGEELGDLEEDEDDVK